jgi:hypothetical protein
MHQSKEYMKSNSNRKLIDYDRTRIDLTRYIEKHTFTFDDTFDSNSSNKQVNRDIDTNDAKEY